MAMAEPMALQFLEFVFKYASIIVLVIMFALICFLPTYLKKLCAIIACCLTIFLVIFLVCFTAVFHPDPTPNVFNFIDIFAVTAVLLAVILTVVRFAFPVVGVPAQRRLRNIFVTNEELAQQTIQDLESGAGDLLMITLKKTTPPPQPTDEVVVNFIYKVDKKSAVFGEECVVCMEELAEEDKCAMLKSAHVYHRECIGKWLETADQRLCPSCRSDPFERMSDQFRQCKAFRIESGQ